MKAYEMLETFGSRTMFAGDTGKYTDMESVLSAIHTSDIHPLVTKDNVCE